MHWNVILGHIYSVELKTLGVSCQMISHVRTTIKTPLLFSHRNCDHSHHIMGGWGFIRIILATPVCSSQLICHRLQSIIMLAHILTKYFLFHLSIYPWFTLHHLALKNCFIQGGKRIIKLDPVGSTVRIRDDEAVYWASTVQQWLVLGGTQSV